MHPAIYIYTIYNRCTLPSNLHKSETVCLLVETDNLDVGETVVDGRLVVQLLQMVYVLHITDGRRQVLMELLPAIYN